MLALENSQYYRTCASALLHSQLLCHICVPVTYIECLGAKSLDGNLGIRSVVDASKPYFQAWHACWYFSYHNHAHLHRIHCHLFL